MKPEVPSLGAQDHHPSPSRDACATQYNLDTAYKPVTYTEADIQKMGKKGRSFSLWEYNVEAYVKAVPVQRLPLVRIRDCYTNRAGNFLQELNDFNPREQTTQPLSAGTKVGVGFAGLQAQATQSYVDAILWARIQCMHDSTQGRDRGQVQSECASRVYQLKVQRLKLMAHPDPRPWEDNWITAWYSRGPNEEQNYRYYTMQTMKAYYKMAHQLKAKMGLRHRSMTSAERSTLLGLLTRAVKYARLHMMAFATDESQFEALGSVLQTYHDMYDAVSRGELPNGTPNVLNLRTGLVPTFPQQQTWEIEPKTKDMISTKYANRLWSQYKSDVAYYRRIWEQEIPLMLQVFTLFPLHVWEIRRSMLYMMKDTILHQRHSTSDIKDFRQLVSDIDTQIRELDAQKSRFATLSKSFKQTVNTQAVADWTKSFSTTAAVKPKLATDIQFQCDSLFKETTKVAKLMLVTQVWSTNLRGFLDKRSTTDIWKLGNSMIADTTRCLEKQISRESKPQPGTQRQIEPIKERMRLLDGKLPPSSTDLASGRLLNLRNLQQVFEEGLKPPQLRDLSQFFNAYAAILVLYERYFPKSVTSSEPGLVWLKTPIRHYLREEMGVLRAVHNQAQSGTTYSPVEMASVSSKAGRVIANYEQLMMFNPVTEFAAGRSLTVLETPNPFAPMLTKLQEPLLPLEETTAKAKTKVGMASNMPSAQSAAHQVRFKLPPSSLTFNSPSMPKMEDSEIIVDNKPHSLKPKPPSNLSLKRVKIFGAKLPSSEAPALSSSQTSGSGPETSASLSSSASASAPLTLKSPFTRSLRSAPPPLNMPKPPPLAPVAPVANPQFVRYVASPSKEYFDRFAEEDKPARRNTRESRVPAKAPVVQGFASDLSSSGETSSSLVSSHSSHTSQSDSSLSSNSLSVSKSNPRSSLSRVHMLQSNYGANYMPLANIPEVSVAQTMGSESESASESESYTRFRHALNRPHSVASTTNTVVSDSTEEFFSYDSNTDN